MTCSSGHQSNCAYANVLCVSEGAGEGEQSGDFIVGIHANVKIFVDIFCFFGRTANMERKELISLIDKRLRVLDISAAEASRRATGNHYLVRNIKNRDFNPNFENLNKLCKVLGLRFSISDGVNQSDANLVSLFSAKSTLPNRGLARCGITGWYNKFESEDLPAPANLDDPDAFYVNAIGHSMVPEGINPGTYCLVSPAKPVEIGDRVWIEDTQNTVSIKRLLDIDDKSYHLRGWLPPDKGKQTNFDDQRFIAGIKQIAPIVSVFNEKPVAGKKPVIVADTREDSSNKNNARSTGWQIPDNNTRVPLAGYAGAGGQVAYDGQFHEDDTAPAPPGSELKLAAVEVRGDSAAPFLREGDRVYFQPDHHAIPERQIGRFVLATTADGAAWLKILRKGDHDDLWNLQSINPKYGMMEDEQLDRITPLVWVHFKGQRNLFKKV